MPHFDLNLSTEQVIELVKQLPASGKYQVLLSLQDELATFLVGVEPAHDELPTLGQADSPPSANPLLELVGKYKNDEQFQQVLKYIEEYRQELDAGNAIDEFEAV